MNTTKEIQEAITRLSRYEREFIAEWTRDLLDDDYRVAEAAPVYGANPESISLTVEEYLKLEEGSPIKHEFVGGRRYAMTSASPRHNVIISNLIVALHSHLRGGPCRAFFADVKVRLNVNEDEIFYYPDVVVVCGQKDLQVRYFSEPRLVIEVLSPSTERIDRREKAYNYREAPSVEEYVLIAQHTPQVTICRRSEAWERQILTSPQETAEFRSIELSLPLERIYEGVL